MKRILTGLLALCLACLCACGSRVESAVSSTEQAAGSVIGVLSGSVSQLCAAQISERVMLYDSPEAMMADLKSGRLDCVLADSGSADSLRRMESGLRVLTPSLSEGEVCFAVARENADLRKKLDEAIAALKEQKVLDGIVQGYRDGLGSTYEPVQTDEERPVLTVALRTGCAPYSYLDENWSFTGIDRDVALAVCDYLGVALEVVPAQGDLLDMVLYGRVSFAGGAILAADPETSRVDFTASFASFRQDVITRK